MNSRSQYNEHDLLLGFFHGQEASFNHLYDILYEPLCYFAEKLTLSRPIAEEITMDVMFKVWKGQVRKFDSFTHLKGYFFEAVRNMSLNYLKKKTRYARHLRQYEGQIRDNIENYRNEEIETNALMLIYQASERLPKECRKVFDLVYKEHLSYQQIALLLGLNVQTVRNHKNRAVSYLKELIKPCSVALILLLVK